MRFKKERPLTSTKPIWDAYWEKKFQERKKVLTNKK